MRENKNSKLLSALLAILMIFSMLPVTTFAEEEMILQEVREEVEKLHVELFELTKQKYIDTLKKFKSNTNNLKNKFSKDISDIGYSSPILDKALSNAINQLISYEKDKMVGTFSRALGYDSKFGRDYFFANAKNFS